jgi:hypothetical protein
MNKASFYPWKSSPQADAFLLWASKNEHKLGWKADLCLLSKTHKNYNKHACEKGISLAQEDNDGKIPFGEGAGF